MKEPRTVADVLRDDAAASQGQYTGSAYNSLLVSQRNLARKQTAGPVGRNAAGGASEPLFPFVDELFQLIPWSVRWGAIGLAFLIAFSYALYSGTAWLGALFWGGGGIIGLIICYRLLIVAVKLVILALCIALLGLAGWAAFWILSVIL